MSRRALVLAALLIAAVLSSCGPASDPTDGLTSRVGQARNAQAVASLQTALVSASTAAAEGPVAAGQLAATLQQRDPTNTYITAPPAQEGQIQVLGGGGGPVMLTSFTKGDGGQPCYVAAWESGGTTRWFAGAQPPAYSPAAPATAGWSDAAPTAASATSAQPVSSAPSY